MKSYIAILFHLVLLSCNSEPDTQTQQEKVASIKRISNGVNRNQDLKSIELDAEEFLDQTPDGGGSLTGYFDNKSLVKIVEWIGLSYGTIEIEYYFDKENLIFAVAKESHFLVTDSGVNHNKLTAVFEGQYYIEKNNFFKISKKGSGIWDSGQDDNIPILANAAEYSKLLYKKKNGD